jgi:hypothetical protein
MYYWTINRSKSFKTFSPVPEEEVLILPQIGGKFSHFGQKCPKIKLFLLDSEEKDFPKKQGRNGIFTLFLPTPPLALNNDKNPCFRARGGWRRRRCSVTTNGCQKNFTD